MDDIHIICPDVETVSSINNELGELFPIKDFGEIREYSGVEVTRNREEETFRLRQPGSIDAVIQSVTQKFRVQSVPRSQYVASIRKEEPATKEQHDWFRSVVGQLGHISRMTRPDIANATNLLGRKLSCPTQEDILLVHNVIGYLQGTREIYLELGGGEFQSIQIKTYTVYLKNQAESILELSIPAKIYCRSVIPVPTPKDPSISTYDIMLIRDYVATLQAMPSGNFYIILE